MSRPTMVARLAAVLLLVAGIPGLVAPRALPAQAQLVDVVYLKDGGIVRGTVVEQIPGESILIRTADGNQFRYQMSLVAKLTREAAGAAPSPAPRTPTGTPGRRATCSAGRKVATAAWDGPAWQPPWG